MMSILNKALEFQNKSNLITPPRNKENRQNENSSRNTKDMKIKRLS